ncbi:hypothetical protein SMGD1_1372 [Sulfurimonas gotlandica GD1]|uniref:Intracellular septation protein A n=1 Tax=Sulfurimonas gotlandica (strain DSM 19862 / JCM 16533 / GD1) TaxID=929558 RepID=B6BHA4_SULGG|nr:hypothetical protein [Sulfurimonas gotlandica]EDZ63493.1 hypothetical protein CBGD1_1113 [Sulfurimonas gotlandica GD1]EHP29896.1 hypothetical protein SMGD1_1372 [Sulfurimonas gotlandica GD1]
MSSVFTLLFAPTFLIFLHYFEFEVVVTLYIALSLLLLLFTYIKYKISKELIVPIIYFLLLVFSFFYASFAMVKFIPVLVSLMFLSIFIDATINKREFILKFTQKFYPKKLSEGEIAFLRDGDKYWIWAVSISTLMQFALTFYDDVLWAFYSSVGWYIFFFLALIIQVLYGRLYAIRMHSK